MKLLFICKHNRFRSKVAEAVFKKLNKDKRIKAESAGTFLDKNRPYAAESVKKIMRERGYKIEGKPRKLTKKMLEKADLAVIVADNIDEKKIKFKGKILKWEIRDCSSEDLRKLRKTINEIEKRVKGLIIRLQDFQSYTCLHKVYQKGYTFL